MRLIAHMRQIFNTVLLSLSLVSFCLNAAPTTEQVEFFEKKIRPVLAEHCYECHNSSGKEKGGFSARIGQEGWQRVGTVAPYLVRMSL